ncbi:MAG: hypothetical protein NVSMB27_47010 [Ktedonobacteraceae bacterium]
MLFNGLAAWITQNTTGFLTLGVEAALLGLLVFVVLTMAQIPLFSESSFIFLSFTISDAMVEYSLGPAPHTLWMYWLLTLATALSGPLLAWASFILMLPLSRPREKQANDSVLSIMLDGIKATRIVFDTQQKRLSIRDSALPHENIQLTVAVPQEQPVTPFFPSSPSSSHGDNLQQINVRTTLRCLISRNLDIEECLLNDDIPLLTYAKDTQALTGFLHAIQQQFQLDVHEVLPSTVSDLVACTFTKQTALQNISMTNAEFKEGIR